MRAVKGVWPIGYLVRSIIEDNQNVEFTLNRLKQTQLISPCYITFYHSEHSVILTRDADRLVHERRTDLIQANKDHSSLPQNNEDILYSLQRVEKIKEVCNLNQNGTLTSNLTTEEFLNEILKFPIINEETIYIYIIRNNNRNCYIC